MSIEIYALLDCSEIRYIGQSRNTAERVVSHWSHRKSKTSPVAVWLRGLSSLPVTRILAVVEDLEADAVEEYAIQAYRHTYPRQLLNVRPRPLEGSPDMDLWDAYQRAKGAAISSGQNAVIRGAKISAARIGKTLPDEWRAAMSAAHTGTTWSAARRAAHELDPLANWRGRRRAREQ